MTIKIEGLSFAEIESLRQMVKNFKGIAQYAGKESLNSVCTKLSVAIEEQTGGCMLDNIIRDTQKEV